MNNCRKRKTIKEVKKKKEFFLSIFSFPYFVSVVILICKSCLQICESGAHGKEQQASVKRRRGRPKVVYPM